MATAMEQRTLEINVISARDLKNVNLLSKMDVYAVVSICGESHSHTIMGTATKQRTTVDRDGGTNPTWNYPIKFTVDEISEQNNRLTLVFRLRCDRSLGDKDIGEVHVPVKELLDGGNTNGKRTQFVSYQVRMPSGKPKGVLNFSYKLGEKVAVPAPALQKAAPAADEPVMAYPVPAVGPSLGYMHAPYYPPAGYPPPAAGYGGSYPPVPAQVGYGYPPAVAAQPWYGYQGVQQPHNNNRNNNNRLGMGLGLGAGLLGGLLIGDMISDAGFGDGFGF